MVIGGVPVYPGKPCPHSTGAGCDDYDNRPIDPCHHFNCGWIIDNSPLPDWIKPDKGKVLVLFNKLRWNGYPVDVAVPVGKRIPPRSLEWLKKFSRDYSRPLIYAAQTAKSKNFSKQQELFAYGPPAFQQDLLRWQQEGKKLW